MPLALNVAMTPGRVIGRGGTLPWHLPNDLKRFKQLGEGTPAWTQAVESAEKHYAIIERFGRFPSRNEILGRESTPEELEFLKTEGSHF